jgi:hypothetical protein
MRVCGLCSKRLWQEWEMAGAGAFAMDEDATDKAVDLLIIHHIRRGTGKSRWRHNLRAYLSWHGRRDDLPGHE